LKEKRKDDTILVRMKRILVVEDDQYIRELYELLLKEAGLEVEAVADGETGLSKAKEGGYDLILLDILLPGKDGLTVLKELKKYPPLKENKKIIMLTALDRDEFVKSAMRMGADGYLIKSSLNPDDVVNEVMAFLK